MPGMPASETTAMTASEPLSPSIISEARSRSLCSWQLIVGVVIAEVVEELLGLAGVLAGDAIGALENIEGAKRDVVEVADGRGDEVEAGCERSVGHCLDHGRASRFPPNSRRRVVKEKSGRRHINDAVQNFLRQGDPPKISPEGRPASQQRRQIMKRRNR